MAHTTIIPKQAALAGVPAGLQAQGVWVGRRQLFVRFAAEAETASMYMVDALAAELKRSLERSTFHSIAIGGRDPLANAEYLRAVFAKAETVTLPVLLDCDGQRPDAILAVRDFVSLVQVTVDGSAAQAVMERALATIAASAAAGIDHAAVFCVDERTTDAQLLRFVQQVHGISPQVPVVVHPMPKVPVDRDRRWPILFEQATALHGDVRLILRLPPPAGMR
jgi:hypothetical protein